MYNKWVNTHTHHTYTYIHTTTHTQTHIHTHTHTYTHTTHTLTHTHTHTHSHTHTHTHTQRRGGNEEETKKEKKKEFEKTLERAPLFTAFTKACRSRASNPTWLIMLPGNGVSCVARSQLFANKKQITLCRKTVLLHFWSPWLRILLECNRHASLHSHVILSPLTPGAGIPLITAFVSALMQHLFVFHSYSFNFHPPPKQKYISDPQQQSVS